MVRSVDKYNLLLTRLHYGFTVLVEEEFVWLWGKTVQAVPWAVQLLCSCGP